MPTAAPPGSVRAGARSTRKASKSSRRTRRTVCVREPPTTAVGGLADVLAGGDVGGGGARAHGPRTGGRTGDGAVAAQRRAAQARGQRQLHLSAASLLFCQTCSHSTAAQVPSLCSSHWGELSTSVESDGVRREHEEQGGVGQCGGGGGPSVAGLAAALSGIVQSVYVLRRSGAYRDSTAQGGQGELPFTPPPRLPPPTYGKPPTRVTDT